MPETMNTRKQYMRDGQRNKIGVMAAIKEGEQIYIGFSKCNIKRDKFDKVIGTRMAYGRAGKHFDSSLEQIYQLITDDVVSQLQQFIRQVSIRNPDSKLSLWAVQLDTVWR